LASSIYRGQNRPLLLDMRTRLGYPAGQEDKLTMKCVVNPLGRTAPSVLLVDR